MTLSAPQLLFDFNKDADLSKWYILDDGVMGGRSNGRFKVNTAGHGLYTGDISLKNNGGFSSLRFDCADTNVANRSAIILKVKGDGKTYQIRIKENVNDYHSFIYFFETSNDWQTIEIPLSEMYASFRGRRLNMPNFEGAEINELGFLYGNKKEESFKLELDNIYIK